MGPSANGRVIRPDLQWDQLCTLLMQPLNQRGQDMGGQGAFFIFPRGEWVILGATSGPDQPNPWGGPVGASRPRITAEIGPSGLQERVKTKAVRQAEQ